MGATVHIICRSKEKGEKAIEEIKVITVDVACLQGQLAINCYDKDSDVFPNDQYITGADGE